MVRARQLTRHRHNSDSARLQHARQALWIVLAGSIAGFTVLMGSSMDAGRLLRDLVFYNLPYLATAGLCWWAPANTRSSRRAWRLLAAVNCGLADCPTARKRGRRPVGERPGQVAQTIHKLRAASPARPQHHPSRFAICCTST